MKPEQIAVILNEYTDAELKELLRKVNDLCFRRIKEFSHRMQYELRRD